MRYIRDYLFGGNAALLANVMGVEGQHLKLCLYGRLRFSSPMLAQLVSKTNVRADWLLCGTGPPLRSELPEGFASLALPHTLGSVFPVFDVSAVPATPAPITFAPDSHEPGTVTAVNVAAARCVANARGADKPVWLLCGKDALYSGARPVITALLKKKYVTGVGMTAAATELDMPTSATTDKAHIARLGAQAGFGFGEALCQWGAPAGNSIFAAAQRMGAPITVHSEFGEVCDYFRVGFRGAELGATFGAVAYVDLLLFTESVRRFAGSPGGVCVALGDGRRFANLFVQALRASRHAADEPHQDFAFVLIEHAPDPHLEHLIRCNGGQFHFIQGDFASEADGLAKACDAVFDGTI